MGSRHLQGTVFTRVKALLRSGALKDKPVWFDVMEVFPPLLQTRINDVTEDGRPPVLVYKEDEIRDMFLARFPLLHKIPLDLEQWEKSNDTSQLSYNAGFEARTAGMPTLNNLVEKYKSFMRTLGDHQSAVEQTVSWILKEEHSGKLKLSWARQVERLKEKDNTTDTIDIMDLFKLSKSNEID